MKNMKNCDPKQDRTLMHIDASEVDKTFQSKNAQNHEDHMDELETAFSVNDIDEIITMNEKDWYDYSAKEENAVKVAVMQKVMIAILQSTLKKGIESTAYKDFKRERKKDARGMYLAVRDAYHKTNSTLTRKDLKGQLGVMKWGPESKLDHFYLKFMTIVKLLGALKDIHAKSKKERKRMVRESESVGP